jgi:hypothetical protein
LILSLTSLLLDTPFFSEEEEREGGEDKEREEEKMSAADGTNLIDTSKALKKDMRNKCK